MGANCNLKPHTKRETEPESALRSIAVPKVVPHRVGLPVQRDYLDGDVLENSSSPVTAAISVEEQYYLDFPLILIDTFYACRRSRAQLDGAPASCRGPRFSAIGRALPAKQHVLGARDPQLELDRSNEA